MSKSKSLVLLRDPPLLAGQSRRLQMLVLLALVWLAALSAYSLIRDGRWPSGGVPAINVGPVVFAEPGTEIPFPIELGSAGGIPRDGLIQIGGLPLLAALSEGYVKKPGTWVVPVSGLAALKLRAPPDKGARWDMAISLMSADGVTLAEARSVLVVMPTAHDPLPCTSAQASPAAPEAPVKPALSWVWPGAKRDAKSVVVWGDDALSRGSVGASRSIYKYAAQQMSWPAAALALAATYDPHELDHLAPLVAPDLQEARSWYLYARKLANARIDFYIWRLEQPQATTR